MPSSTCCYSRSGRRGRSHILCSGVTVAKRRRREEEQSRKAVLRRPPSPKPTNGVCATRLTAPDDDDASPPPPLLFLLQFPVYTKERASERSRSVRLRSRSGSSSCNSRHLSGEMPCGGGAAGRPNGRFTKQLSSMNVASGAIMYSQQQPASHFTSHAAAVLSLSLSLT